MSDKNEPTLIQGHEYDGIQEYDNPTPGWWHLIFLGSIIFSFFYFIMSFGSPFFVGPYEHLAAAQEAEYQRMFAGIGELENDEQTILTLMDNEKWVAIASGTFRGNCVSCHGASGGGQVGPNLCDDSYKNVRTVTDIYDVIANGAANGAMPAWGNRFSHNEIVLLASYVASMRGTSPSGTVRGPEGEAIPAWPEVGSDPDSGVGAGASPARTGGD
ncbi:MAG: cbb3-type cytochrome c oxidase N-terminal domain-containing protein [Phycisphaerales bacterium]